MPETVTTHTTEETKRLAAAVASRLPKIPHDRALVITLRGDLGAGKTTFTQGLVEALGVHESVTSPTFLLVHRYPLASGAFRNVYHVDAYRLEQRHELDALGMAETLADPENLVVVEWPEVGGALFQPNVDISITHGDTADERTFAITYP